MVRQTHVETCMVASVLTYKLGSSLWPFSSSTFIPGV